MRFICLSLSGWFSVQYQSCLAPASLARLVELQASFAATGPRCVGTFKTLIGVEFDSSLKLLPGSLCGYIQDIHWCGVWK